MKTLDLTLNGEIPFSYVLLYNRIAFDIRKDFNDLIGAFFRNRSTNMDVIVSSPASRNTFASPLFHYCCCLALLQELVLKNEPITEIISDSKAFKKIVENYVASRGLNVRVTLPRLPIRQRLKKIIRPVCSFFATPFRQLLLFIIAKKTLAFQKPFVPETLTLIDTFILPGYTDYYPGLLDALSEEERQSVYFVPLIAGYRPRQYLSVVKQLRRSSRNFVLKEDYLRLRDYLYAWGHFFRIRVLKVGTCIFQGIDISSLVREEMNSCRGFDSSFQSLLNYCFAKRLKKAGIQLKLVIDWFENQIVDRGWNTGFRCFFPETAMKGYQGFVPTSHYLCMYPTEEEMENAVIPKEVVVIGKGLVESARKFCANLDVTVAPAFRFQRLWQKRRYSPNSNAYTILVALPILMDESVRILTLLAYVTRELNQNVRLWIKPHPTTPPSQIKMAFSSKWPEQFEVISGDFNDCLEESDLLISGTSSACLETIAKGIPVVVVGNRTGLTHNPIPEAITGDIWQLCYTQDEVAKAIQFYQNRSPEQVKEHEEVGRRVRKEYFEPVTREGVRRFLELEG